MRLGHFPFSTLTCLATDAGWFSSGSLAGNAGWGHTLPGFPHNTVARSVSEHPMRLPGKSCIVVYDLASEVTSIASTTFCFLEETLPRLDQIQREEN